MSTVITLPLTSKTTLFDLIKRYIPNLTKRNLLTEKHLLQSQLDKETSRATFWKAQHIASVEKNYRLNQEINRLKEALKQAKYDKFRLHHQYKNSHSL